MYNTRTFADAEEWKRAIIKAHPLVIFRRTMLGEYPTSEWVAYKPDKSCVLGMYNISTAKGFVKD
jgi:hypothetical protein